MSRIAVENLSDGQHITQAFRAVDKQLRVNRQGGKYILLKLADRTGTIAGMFWNADECIFDSFDRGDFVHCDGRTQVHNGSLQIIVSEIERMDPIEVDLGDFERFDAAESERLLTQLKDLFAEFRNVHLRKLGVTFLDDREFCRKFAIAPAAVNNHHAYPGGLIRHTIDLMEIARFVGDRYDEVDTEQVMMGAFLHDIGKIEELSGEGESTYTDRGQLVGHIVIGIQMLGDQIAKLTAEGETFPIELRNHLEHLIVSHHGQLEYGSPKLPATLEAILLHHIDNLDAKVTAFTSLIKADVSADGNWTNYQPSIGRKLWKKRD